MNEALKNKIIKIHANAGCIGAKKILLTLQGLGYKKLKLKDIEEVLSTCELCLDIRNHGRPRKSAPGISIAKEKTCQCTIYMDHKMILNKQRVGEISDNSSDPNYSFDDKVSVLTIFEPLSSLVWFQPVKNYSSEGVKEALRAWMMVNGPPTNVVSDNAANFVVLKKWLKEEFDSTLHMTSVYHPQSNLSERAHREFERVIKIYDSKCKEFKFEKWQDHLAKSVVMTNSLRHSKYKISPYETHKNRIQSDVLPLSFHPATIEQKLSAEKFNSKVEDVMSSTLKVVLPTFIRGQKVKVSFPDQEPRYGVVTATKDVSTRMSIQVKFGTEKSVSVSKNYICLPRNGAVNQEETSVPPGNSPPERSSDIQEQESPMSLPSFESPISLPSF